MQGFLTFVREQGVAGLAVGFVLGGAVSKVVASLVSDVINPILGLILGSVSGLQSMAITLAGAEIKVGSFVSVLIDFIVVSAVVYVLFKQLGLDKLDKKKA